MNQLMRIGSGAAMALSLLLGGCTGAPASSPGTGQSTAPSKPAASGTVTLWDYYGESTPLKQVIAAFSKDHPEITVKYEAYAYDAIHDKFPVAATSDAAPDLATIDMTWVPQYASAGLLSDIAGVSGGQLNGQSMKDSYSAGAYEAMQYDGKLVTAMMDFDAYSLYYRKDLLDAAGVSVPITFDELVTAAGKVAKGSGTKRTQAILMPPSVFHFAGAVAQHGGTLLSGDLKRATFNSAEGVAALTDQKRLLDAGGLYWGPESGDYMAGIADGRIAMFIDGPYMMGVLKSGAKEQSGKWAVASAPFTKQAGSYLGGTGLVVPAKAKNPAAAWVLAQYILQAKNQELLFKTSGAAPATKAGLVSPALTTPDPFFGGQAPFATFGKSMETAVHLPYSGSWDDVSKALTKAIESVYLGKATPADALNQAAKEADAALNS